MISELNELKQEKLNKAIELIDEQIQELIKLKQKFIEKTEEIERIKILLD